MRGMQAPEAQAACRAAAYGVVRAAYRGVPAQLLKSRVMEAAGGNKVRSAARHLKSTTSHRPAHWVSTSYPGAISGQSHPPGRGLSMQCACQLVLASLEFTYCGQHHLVPGLVCTSQRAVVELAGSVMPQL